MKYSFREFITLPNDIQESLSTFQEEELSPSIKKKKMLDFEKALKQKDWTYFVSDDGRDRKRGEVENEKIMKMKDELGSDGTTVYDIYYKKLMPKYFREARKDPRPSHYEKHLEKKMRQFGITDLDQLEGEAKIRFHAELDSEYVPENKSMFPEQNAVDARGTLDYAVRQEGDKSITAHSFSDGNLYPEPKWTAPTNNRRGKY